MTRRSPYALLLKKEVRAILPAFVAITAVLGAAALLEDSLLRFAALTAAVLGPAAFGALSMGHEYTYGTLVLALSRPVSRQALLLVKGMAVIAAIVLLSLLVMLLLGRVPLVNLNVTYFLGRTTVSASTAQFDTARTVLVLPVLCGVFLAPWLTLMCRSTIAGVIFTAALPALTWLGAAAVLAARYGIGAPIPHEAERLPLRVLWGACLLLCAAGAAGTWRLFIRMEAIDGPSVAVHLPRWLSRASRVVSDHQTGHRPVLWLLAQKEVRLLQMVFMLAGLYVIGHLALRLLQPIAPDMLTTLANVSVVLYRTVVAWLIGSVTFAEEQRFGTVAWQLLLPVSVVRQWTVKVTVALGLVVLLAFVLPVLLETLAPVAGYESGLRAAPLLLVLALACASLYVSSLSRDAVHALLAVPLAIGAGSTVVYGVVHARRVVSRLIEPVVIHFAPDGLPFQLQHWMSAVDDGMPVVLLLGALALLLRLTMRNYARLDRDARHIARQVGWLGVSLVGLMLLGAVTSDVASIMRFRTNTWCATHPEDCRAQIHRMYNIWGYRK
ncbi:MAG: hypothetical protein ABI051_13700 [Vicinamibacterales bacterium]